jgi:hypothetical protein
MGKDATLRRTAGATEIAVQRLEALAGDLESRITPQDRAEWTKGTIEDGVIEGSPIGSDRGLRRPGQSESRTP